MMMQLSDATPRWTFEVSHKLPRGRRRRGRLYAGSHGTITIDAVTEYTARMRAQEQLDSKPHPFHIDGYPHVPGDLLSMSLDGVTLWDHRGKRVLPSSRRSRETREALKKQRSEVRKVNQENTWQQIAGNGFDDTTEKLRVQDGVLYRVMRTEGLSMCFVRDEPASSPAPSPLPMPLIRAFVHTNCVVDPAASVPVKDLYKAWKKRVDRTNVEFGRDLRAVVPVQRKRSRRAGAEYVGIRLIDGGRRR
jgi:hypothetical protein